MEICDFGEFQLQEEGAASGRPAGDYPSIDEVLNNVIYVTGFCDDVETENGKRILVRFRWNADGAETAFFTRSKKLRSTLLNPSIKFPFATIVKVVFVRDMASFEFRSSKEVVSQQDKDNLNMYLIKKRGYMKQRR